jgi:hypothetical protein
MKHALRGNVRAFDDYFLPRALEIGHKPFVERGLVKELRVNEIWRQMEQFFDTRQDKIIHDPPFSRLNRV